MLVGRLIEGWLLLAGWVGWQRLIGPIGPIGPAGWLALSLSFRSIFFHCYAFITVYVLAAKS
jgi:hypothetical protein